ncbi:DUF1801 domain-containing protein [Herbiconiux sp. L3-i23]|uniref:DUF1801 domain-containing protein n=1 Tax=Herbiconiux sp. L3-i23 TaxID=2905871 RepID=UPI002055E8C2|nr:DUF1801 domain-containing protein [Herbiconiux sp. L3-i23]BDI23118.1 hypothetical protein L3i23_18940 [Herbiconiux sp. L3-i23]
MAEKRVGLSAEERAAMKAYAKEQKAAAEGAAALQACLDAIAKMSDEDRPIVQRLHKLILEASPELQATTWYGMPAYAKAGTTICFVKNAGKFKDRYATLGFQSAANLDDGGMWAKEFAVLALGPDEERRVVELVTKAVSS